jgi:hypothetical protein
MVLSALGGKALGGGTGEIRNRLVQERYQGLKLEAPCAAIDSWVDRDLHGLPRLAGDLGQLSRTLPYLEDDMFPIRTARDISGS